MIEHVVSVSGGKDSLACYLLALERGRPFRAVAADADNEHEIWREYVESIPRLTGGPAVEIVKADFSALFPARRDAIRVDWTKERRRKKHSQECKIRWAAVAEFDDDAFERSPEIEALSDQAQRLCAEECPIHISPPVPAEMIEAACEALQPSGNAFLDLCMLKGRFPGVKSRFCTDFLKLQPMIQHVKLPLWERGISTIEWIGERAQESPARANKPALQRIRQPGGIAGVSTFLYRPIHQLKHEDVFAIAKRHGIPPNPLYLQGMGRVGCMPCIMAKKGELRKIAQRFPHHIDRIERWEGIVAKVSRRSLGEPASTFFAAKMVPGEGDYRANIRAAVAWARTGRGGWNYDLLIAAELAEADEDGLQCDSEYGLCE
jgi:3'-phosphoadenosine 5'-phosphosulfate sulfotransferase (PAPS reductase)/FAD synthetase